VAGYCFGAKGWDCRSGWAFLNHTQRKTFAAAYQHRAHALEFTEQQALKGITTYRSQFSTELWLPLG
jgi:hypothetical protein